MQHPIRIGTRSSELALYQANLVKSHLTRLGISSELVPVVSTGDHNQITPIYEQGIQGVFTRELDIALLNHEIDIAVHSLKDVPTILPQGLILSAYLKRESPHDILVRKSGVIGPITEQLMHIATGSIRRRAQWLYRYPNHTFSDLRGNVNTRLAKLDNSSWDGAIFAQTGLDRIGLTRPESEVLDWMIPAAGQGVITVCQRSADEELEDLMASINDVPTQQTSTLERSFTQGLGGGCSQPVGAYATLSGNTIKFTGRYTMEDGSKEWTISEELDIGADFSKAKAWGENLRNTINSVQQP